MKQHYVLEKQKNEFGGSLLKGKRKSRRPIDSKLPTHLVFKATNPNLLLRHHILVRRKIKIYADRFGIKIFECAVQADHIHLALAVPNRELYVRWVRAVTSVLVQLIRGLKWKLRPYTRLANWGRPLLRLLNYIKENQREADFLISGHERYERWRRYAYSFVPRSG